jgi:hypothetical protein
MPITKDIETFAKNITEKQLTLMQLNKDKINILQFETDVLKTMVNDIKPLKKKELPNIIHKLLIDSGKPLSIMDISKLIWKQYKLNLIVSGDLFYTWQYDFRWAATELRKRGIMKSCQESKKGFWELI